VPSLLGRVGTVPIDCCRFVCVADVAGTRIEEPTWSASRTLRFARGLKSRLELGLGEDLALDSVSSMLLAALLPLLAEDVLGGGVGAGLSNKPFLLRRLRSVLLRESGSALSGVLITDGACLIAGSLGSLDRGSRGCGTELDFKGTV
jgi:hypothetical protein